MTNKTNQANETSILTLIIDSHEVGTDRPLAGNKFEIRHIQCQEIQCSFIWLLYRVHASVVTLLLTRYCLQFGWYDLAITAPDRPSGLILGILRAVSALVKRLTIDELVTSIAQKPTRVCYLSFPRALAAGCSTLSCARLPFTVLPERTDREPAVKCDSQKWGLENDLGLTKIAIRWSQGHTMAFCNEPDNLLGIIS